MALNPGDIIENKYRIVRLLGEGGMGAVFEGENVRIKRRVAIKVLHAAIAHDPSIARRFQQEAQAAGHIGNEHIIEVLDLGELPNGDHFMVMEYLDGEPLTSRIKRMGKLTPEQTIPLFKQILEGLGAAHNAGILHRDLKPDNIFILNERGGQKDFVKIIDFGISKFQPLAGEMKMTRTGTLMGTPYYMSPEQASGAREMNAQSDIYAIGVILYETLTGAVPFDAPTFNQLMFRIVLSEAAPIEALLPNLNPAFATIVKKAMAREQSHRFTSCQEFIAALEAWASSGAGVDVPPVAAADVYLPDGANAASPAVTGIGGPALSKTNQAWANTNSPATTTQAPKKNKAPVFIGAAAAMFLVVGGAAAFFLVGSGEGDAGATAGVGEEPSKTDDSEVAKPDAPPAQVDTAAREEPPPTSNATGAATVALEPTPSASVAAAAAEEPAPAGSAEATEPKPVSGRRPAQRPPSPTPKKPSESKKRDFGY